MDATRLNMLSEFLVEADTNLKDRLVELRREKGISIDTVTARMGVVPGFVEEFESYWFDPRLSQLRRYALAIEVRIKHEVIDFDESRE